MKVPEIGMVKTETQIVKQEHKEQKYSVEKGYKIKTLARFERCNKLHPVPNETNKYFVFKKDSVEILTVSKGQLYTERTDIKYLIDAYWNSEAHVNEKGELYIIGLNHMLIFNPETKECQQIISKGVKEI